MKVEIVIDKDSNGTEIVKAKGWFYQTNKETGKVELNEDGTKKTVKSNKIVASVSIPNSIGNRGTYIDINEDVASTYDVQLKSKWFDNEGQWVFKNEKWSKESKLEEFFIGNKNNFQCDCTFELKDKEFYVGFVNKHGYFVVTEKYDKLKAKSKRNDKV